MKLTALLVCGGVILLSLAACKTNQADSARYPNVTMGGGVGLDQINAKIYKPEGPGPHPAVILLHGCDGAAAHIQGWGSTVASWGYVAVVVDSFGSRGLGAICTETSLVDPYERILDIIGTTQFLKIQPYVKADSIGLMGFSHGGWTILKGLQGNMSLARHNIKAAVAYYPYCTASLDADISLPLLVLIGEDDNWTLADHCRKLQAALKRPNLVEMVFLKNAHHGFDYPPANYTIPGRADGVTVMRRVQYNGQAAAEASTKAKAFLDSKLK